MTISAEDAMKELNEYFKSFLDDPKYVNQNTSESNNSEQQNGGLSTFDDIMDSINHDQKTFDETLDEINSLKKITDVEVLTEEIDKNHVSGGADASKIIENMAGGNKKKQNNTDNNNNKSGTDHKETPDDKIIPEAGVPYIYNMNGENITLKDIMLSSDDEHENNSDGDNYDSDNNSDDEMSDDEITEEYNKIVSQLGGKRKISHDNADVNDNESDSDKLDENNELIDTDDELESGLNENDFASDDEIDEIVKQLNRQTGLNLTGGNVKINKKACLTNMFPYVIRR